MFNTLLKFLDYSSKSFLETIKRFPLVSFSAYLLTLILIIFMSIGHGNIEDYANYNIANKIAFTLTLAIPFLLAIRLISPNKILLLLGLSLLTLYYFTLPPTLESNSQLYEQKHIIFILSSILFIIPAPFLFRSVKNENFWEWTKQLIFNIFWTLLFGTIIYLGLLGVIFAFEKLFDIVFPHNLKAQIALLVYLLFSVNYFLSQIPKYPLLLQAKPYSKIETILSKYILTPLMLIYFAILFSYTFKIILLNQFPNGTMSWLVLVFSALAIITFLFWTGIWTDKNSHYKKWIWIAILLQTFVLATSLYMRINQYGFTENRYYIMLMGIWLFGISLYFLLKKTHDYKWIFISLSLLSLMTQVEPFSAKSISKTSQEKQLKTLLITDNNLSETSDINLRYKISNTIEYLYAKHSIDSLMPIIPDIVENYKHQSNNKEDCSVTAIHYFPKYATKELGFTFIDKWQWKAKINSNKEDNIPIYIHSQTRNSSQDIINIDGYTWLINFEFYNDSTSKSYCPPENINAKDNIIPFTVSTKSDTISIKRNSQILASITIKKFMDKVKQTWLTKYKNDEHQVLNPYSDVILTEKELTYLYENHQVKVKILFQTIAFSPEKKLDDYRGRILINIK